MNYVRKKIKDFIQILVDSTSGRIIDLISLITYSIIAGYAFRVSKIIYDTIKSDTPIIPKSIPPTFYAILIIMPMMVYYLSLAGEFFKKPSRRIQFFIFSIICTTIFAAGYVLQIVNTGFVGWLNGINNISVIPSSLLVGNIRLVSFIFPLAMVIPITTLIAQMVADKGMRKDIREYEIDLLLPTVNKMDETTVDIKICEDIETGEDCIVPEKKTFEHTFLQGGTGSGKTATYIKPVLQQLFGKKSFLNERLKELAFESLNEGIAVINQPINNHWLNNYFSMDYISPKNGKEKEFIKKFEKYIIGIRDKDVLVYSDITDGGTIALNHLEGDSKYEISVKVIDNGLECLVKSCDIFSKTTTQSLYLSEKFKEITITTYNNSEKNEEDIVEDILNKGTVIEENQEVIRINLPKLGPGLEYNIQINERGSGKIIYKGVGLCVVAPDGGLVSDSIKIANDYSVKVHKIDPTMEEIRKGKIAKFNPLKGGRPDKVGDIISSILVSMDNAQGQNKSNPFFTNASVRAVRNLVILLKVMYPVMNGGYDPTLRDVLDCLNDFSKVVPMVEAMKKDVAKKEKWGSVINYFESNFYPIPTDSNGKQMTGMTTGSQRKKTEDSISGIINQLDNFVTREEVAYILCDRENSIDLNDIIENGECLAISTRQNELGERLGKAFALFFILSIQNVVLSRYSEDENPEVPFHMIIDEFPFYINDNTKVFFTFARKYRCAMTIAIQNMAQLREISDVFRETIFTNTDTKILLPKSNVEDRKYWSEYFGTYQSFEMQTGVTSSSIFSDSPKYSEQRRGTLTDVTNVSEQEINELNFKEALYSYTDKKGRIRIGKGLTDFMKEKKNYTIKQFKFEQFNHTSNNKQPKIEETKLDSMEKAINIDLPRQMEINTKETNKYNDTDGGKDIKSNEDSKQVSTSNKGSVKEVKTEIEDRRISFETTSEITNYDDLNDTAIGNMELDSADSDNKEVLLEEDLIKNIEVSTTNKNENPESVILDDELDPSEIEFYQAEYSIEGE